VTLLTIDIYFLFYEAWYIIPDTMTLLAGGVSGEASNDLRIDSIANEANPLTPMTSPM